MLCQASRPSYAWKELRDDAVDPFEKLGCFGPVVLFQGVAVRCLYGCNETEDGDTVTEWGLSCTNVATLVQVLHCTG